MSAPTAANAATWGRFVTAATVLTVALKISFDHCAGRRSGNARAWRPDSCSSRSIPCTVSKDDRYGPIQVSVSSSYSMWLSVWRTPLMNVTAETSGQSPCRATSSSAPRPFWIVITVAPAMRPASRSAAASTSVAFVARMTRSASGSPAASSAAVTRETRSLLPLMRRPLRTSASACSGRRVSTETSATCARCPA